MEKLPEGTPVITDLGSEHITGEICGIASIELPGVGYIYIIRITGSKGKAFDEYPYSCMVLPQSCFKKIEKNPI